MTTQGQPDPATVRDRRAAVQAGEGDDGSRSGSILVGLRRHLRVEDVLLLVWLIVQPVLFRPSSTSAAQPNLFFGLADIVALVGLAACVAARSRPGLVSGIVANGTVLGAVGPLCGAVVLAIDDTSTNLGLGSDAALLPVALAIGAAIAARWLMPPLSTEQRRALVTPFVVVTSGFFGRFLSGLADFFDLRQLAASASSSTAGPGLTALVLGFAIAGVAVFYAMLVFAPRQVADREGSPRTWLVRFAVFAISLALGQTLAGYVSP